ncbi:hypothetical protein [Primorskyibacter sp. 2E233]|uniref:hypothetical protein n=1 Tax=Primorskyibacter sp. 2E233 TaxID=3413431 RepID=UPI003BF34AE3
MATSEYLDDAHEPAAAGAWFAQGERDGLWLSVLDICLIWRLDAKQCTDFGEAGLADTTGQEAVVPNAMEPIHFPAVVCLQTMRGAAGSVKTTWKYSTGSRSSARAAIQSRAAGP